VGFRARELFRRIVPLPQTRQTSRYDLTDAEIESLSDELRSRYRAFLSGLEQAGAAFGCIAVDGNDPLANLGRTLEQRVFDDEAGEHSVETMHVEYGAYEDRSTFFLGYDLRTGSVSGSLRAITGNAGYGPMVKSMRDCVSIESYRDLGLPGAADEIDLRESALDIDLEVGFLGGHRSPPGHRLDRRFLESYHAMRPGDGIFDMATVVVPRSIRSTEAQKMSLVLYACSWRGALALNIPHAVTFIRQSLLDDFRSRLAMDWEDLAGLGGTQYVDGDPFLSQPAYAHLEAFRHVFVRENTKAQLGIEQKSGPPFDSFVQLVMSPKTDPLFLLY